MIDRLTSDDTERRCRAVGASQRSPSNSMKTKIIILALLLPAMAIPKPFDYDSSVTYVKENSPLGNSEKEHPLYVAAVPGDPPVFADVHSNTNNLSLRQVIDQTRYNGKDVSVIILRKKNKTIPVFRRIVKSNESTDFRLQDCDVIMLSKPGIPEK